MVIISLVVSIWWQRLTAEELPSSCVCPHIDCPACEYKQKSEVTSKPASKTSNVNVATTTATAPNAEFICQAPSGQLNDCAWRCLNNPSKTSVCRTDLPQVQCERRRCNASGQWTEPTRLPASSRDFCPPGKIVVKPCDY